MFIIQIGEDAGASLKKLKISLQRRTVLIVVGRKM